MGSFEGARIPLQLSRGYILASVQVDLSDDVLRGFRSDLLELLEASDAYGVVVDLTGVEVMDAEDFAALRRTLAMASVMGARTILCGLQPGVVAGLVELGADVDGVLAARSLDDALARLDETRATVRAASPRQPNGAESEGAQQCD